MSSSVTPVPVSEIFANYQRADFLVSDDILTPNEPPTTYIVCTLRINLIKWAIIKAGVVCYVGTVVVEQHLPMCRGPCKRISVK